MNVIQFLSGKKTYLTGLLALMLVFGSWQKWWNIPDQAYEALMALALIFLRAGVAKRPAASDPDLQPAKSPAARRAPLMTLAVACLPLALGASFIITGCSTTAQKAAFEAVGTTQVSVDTAMKLWGTYVAISHPPVSQEEAVEAAYAKYQAAMANVCDAGEVYASVNAAGTNVYGTTASAGLALQQAIRNADNEITDLENLIASFGVSLTTNAP